MLGKTISRSATLLGASLLFCPPAYSQSNDCPTVINGALKGGSGNIQDHMFHSLAIDPNNENKDSQIPMPAMSRLIRLVRIESRLESAA